KRVFSPTSRQAANPQSPLQTGIQPLQSSYASLSKLHIHVAGAQVAQMFSHRSVLSNRVLLPFGFRSAYKACFDRLATPTVRRTGGEVLNRKIRILGTLVFAIVMFHACYGQDGAIVRPQNLAQMTDEAGTILQGRVVSVRMEPHPQLSNLQT